MQMFQLFWDHIQKDSQETNEGKLYLSVLLFKQTAQDLAHVNFNVYHFIFFQNHVQLYFSKGIIVIYGFESSKRIPAHDFKHTSSRSDVSIQKWQL